MHADLKRGSRPVQNPLEPYARDYNSQKDTLCTVVLTLQANYSRPPLHLLFSSPRNTTPYLPTSEGHRERVLSLSQALAAEASQWHRMMTGENGLGTLGSWVLGKRESGGPES